MTWFNISLQAASKRVHPDEDFENMTDEELKRSDKWQRLNEREKKKRRRRIK